MTFPIDPKWKLDPSALRLLPYSLSSYIFRYFMQFCSVWVIFINNLIQFCFNLTEMIFQFWKKKPCLIRCFIFFGHRNVAFGVDVIHFYPKFSFCLILSDFSFFMPILNILIYNLSNKWLLLYLIKNHTFAKWEQYKPKYVHMFQYEVWVCVCLWKRWFVSDNCW